MNFFEHQKAARRQTRLLLPLYLLAVVFVVVAVNIIVTLAMTGIVGKYDFATAIAMWKHLGLTHHAKVAGVTLAIILGTSLYRVMTLKSGGGPSVAKMAGGRRVSPNSNDLNERRLSNIVEEMSIASGIRVPEAYVLDREASINAFAAGFTFDDAVVAVSRGALDQLNREELQGVMGHEFSHILNGDMRLNIQMLGTLSGLQAIGSIGGKFMRGSVEMLKHLDDLRHVALAFPFFLFGLAIWIVGSLGVLAARLIQAGISRQREFLADASSVQFTRNPGGIGGALRKIAVGGSGSRFRFRGAEEFSHMAFGPTVLEWAGVRLASHPPVHERLARLGLPMSEDEIAKTEIEVEQPRAPAFNFELKPEEKGFTITLDTQAVPPLQGILSAAVPLHAILGAGAQPLRAMSSSVAVPVQEASPALAGVAEVDIDHAANLIAALPETVRAAAHYREGATAIAIALLLESTEYMRERQLTMIPDFTPAVRDYYSVVERLGAEIRLPLFDLALPALKTLDPQAKEKLKKVLDALAMADGTLTLREFVFYTLIVRGISSTPSGTSATQTLEALSQPFAVLLAHVAAASSSRRERVAAAFSSGMNAAGIKAVSPDVMTLAALKSAFDALAMLRFEDKPRVMKALAAAAACDGFIAVNELELIRAAGAALDWPVPPLKITTSIAAAPEPKAA